MVSQSPPTTEWLSCRDSRQTHPIDVVRVHTYRNIENDIPLQVPSALTWSNATPVNEGISTTGANNLQSNPLWQVLLYHLLQKQFLFNSGLPNFRNIKQVYFRQMLNSPSALEQQAHKTAHPQSSARKEGAGLAEALRLFLFWRHPRAPMDEACHRPRDGRQLIYEANRFALHFDSFVDAVRWTPMSRFHQIPCAANKTRQCESRITQRRDQYCHGRQPASGPLSQMNAGLVRPSPDMHTPPSVELRVAKVSRTHSGPLGIYSLAVLRRLKERASQKGCWEHVVLLPGADCS